MLLNQIDNNIKFKHLNLNILGLSVNQAIDRLQPASWQYLEYNYIFFI